MDKVSGRLTVFFEDPFWVGVFECISDGELSVCKVTFGAEPKDYEVYDFVLKNYYQLRFSPVVATDVKETGRNPKRIQREVRKQVQNAGIGTKSQQALKLQQEQLKTAIPQKEREVTKLKTTVSGADNFIARAKRYTDIQELTPELLRLFIEKIVVHEKDVKWSKHASQTVEIHYTDIGVVGNMNITKSA